MVVIEVSKSQGRVFMCEYRDMIARNRYKALLGQDNDWVMVDTARTDREAENKAAFWRGVMRQREA